MPIAAGTMLGPYEILAPIGAGGMGEVYRARDTRLNREVAVKVSAQQFNERFAREARSIAALNHNNVCHLYDVGPNYLVMELVEGETLAGPMKLERALPVIRQLIDGIEAAHEKNIIHRDLKPANIKITAAGVVKILDFGLARTADGARDEASPENSPTITIGSTQAGTILGTASYMSPEQAKGKTATRRSDIWSFGVVVYELLTGKRAFDGETVVETLGAVLNKDPDWTIVPPQAQRLLRRSMEREPSRRLGSIGDARWMLEEGLNAPAPQAAPPPSRFNNAGWIVGAVMTVALAALAFVHFREKPAADPGVARFTIAPPEGAVLTLNNPNSPQVAVSPDGREIAFIANERTAPGSLWVRPLNSLTAQRLDRTEGAELPFWSPDSQFIAFFQDGKLKRIPVSGGSPLTICDAPDGDGGAWSSDQVIVFAPNRNGPLHRVVAAGGVSAPLTTLANGETGHSFPQFLPDGRLLYLVRGGSPAKEGIYVQSLGSTQRTFILATQGRSVYSPPGFLLFLREGILLAQRFNLRNLHLEGEPVSVAEGVRTSTVNNGRNDFSVSGNGVLVYRAGGGRGSAQLTWYTRDGKPAGTALQAGNYNAIELSPDGKRVAVERMGEGTNATDLWLLDLPTGVFSRLTSGPDNEVDPVWSPDSQRLDYAVRGKELAIREKLIGAADSPVYSDGKQISLDDWSRDGKLLIYHTGNTVFSLPLTGERKPQTAFQAPAEIDQLRLSPDGRWIAYMSRETGRPEIYLAAFPSFTARRQVSSGGGVMPLWRRDGRELFYAGIDDREMIAVEIAAGSTLQTGAVKKLFGVPGALSFTFFYYAVTGDGQKFLFRENANQSGVAVEPLNVVMNWPAVLGH